ncbi:acyl CoA:acetate/3-ketoacid CoA transferase subunit alpha [Bacillus sp. AFS015802]|uniref:3-oxoacid CoA-transferase subunit A n=1 Tax=Bacillus sp. AFS015802 TaxID=2033486 RepID=UPI000BF4B296|nr:3-oxoacid CoA-transferase subunit A [Bacillus sp. AFS015802]PFA70134.1 acyl CoA:acetate/3-ketoacid CoA transferase subunit alpha [Bacillus sp. AFS015802]
MSNHHNKMSDYEEIKHFFHDEMTMMFGGFGGVGSPPTILNHLLKWGVKDLTIIGNDTGFPHIGIGQLVAQNRVKKVIASHIGSNPIAGRLMSEGKLEVEFSPQGILAERIRAGGVGLKGVVTEIGVDDPYLNKGKTFLEMDGNRYLYESALVAEVGIVFAKKADTFGNLIYDKSARNTNPLIAMAADITIVEAEEVVGYGELDPEEIVTSGVFVDHIVLSKGVDWKWAWEAN